MLRVGMLPCCAEFVVKVDLKCNVTVTMIYFLFIYKMNLKKI